MGPSHDNLEVSGQDVRERLAALQAAIEKHARQESDGRVEQDRQLSEIQYAVDALVAFMTTRKTASLRVSESIQAQYRSLAEVLDQFDPDSMARLERELGESKSSLGVAKNSISDLEKLVEKQTEEAREVATKAQSDLQQLKIEIDRERSRANVAETRVKVATDESTPSVLAEQLAESLKEREQVLLELSDLQEEVARLKDSPPVAVPAPAK